MCNSMRWRSDLAVSSVHVLNLGYQQGKAGSRRAAAASGGQDL